MKKISIVLKDGRVMNAELYEDKAPITVENFVRLIEEKFFDGLCFHRVIPSFMIQGGGFEAEDGGLKHKEAEKQIKGEFASNGWAKNDISHTPGVLSMARTMIKNSATSQFFICVSNCAYLDGEYAAFGKLTDEESLKTAVDISVTPTGSWMQFDDVPLSPVVIDTIKMLA